MVATGVSSGERWEVPGAGASAIEGKSSRLAFLCSLRARGLSGVRLVISDARVGRKAAIAAVFTGSRWQRCHMHLTTDLVTEVRKALQPCVAALFRMILLRQGAGAVRQQAKHVLAILEQRWPDVANLLTDALEGVPALTTFPKEHQRQIWSSDPQEWLNKESRRRTDVAGTLPKRASIFFLVAALLAEQHAEWAVGRGYFPLESVAQLHSELKTLPDDRQPQLLPAA